MRFEPVSVPTKSQVLYIADPAQPGEPCIGFASFADGKIVGSNMGNHPAGLEFVAALRAQDGNLTYGWLIANAEALAITFGLATPVMQDGPYRDAYAVNYDWARRFAGRPTAEILNSPPATEPDTPGM